MAILIDGKALAAKVKDQLIEEAKDLPRRPGLAVILVGKDPASRIYVTNKEKDCEQCGFLSYEYKLPEETSEEELLEMIRYLNGNNKVDGILVQMPIPPHLDEEKIIFAISPDKDVDAFHPVNVGRMVIGDPVVSALYSGRDHGDVQGVWHFHSGEALRGAGTLQHRGKPHGYAV